MEYYLALNTNEILTHTTEWINLEDIIGSKIRQAQKGTFYIICILQ